MKRKKYVYMKITDDKFELPLEVADTSIELSEITGVSVNTIISAITRHERDGRASQYIRVEV